MRTSDREAIAIDLPEGQASSFPRFRSLVALLLLVPAPSIGVLVAMVWEPTRGTDFGQAVYLLSKAWILLFPAMWLMLVDRQRPGLSPARQGGLLVGATSGLVIAAGILGAYWFLARSWIDADLMRQTATLNGIGEPLRYLALVAGLSFVNSLLEEYVWRWFVFRKCESLVGGRLAVIASALFFTLHHVVALKVQTGWNVTLLASLGVFIGGCAWSWCYLRYRSIWPGYASHIIADLAVFAVGWHVLFGWS